MKYILLLTLLLMPTLASASGVKISWNQVVFEDKNRVIELTKNWSGMYYWIQDCPTDTWVFHYTLVKNFWDFSLVKNMITCVADKYIQFFNEFTTWPYIGIFPEGDGGAKYTMPTVIPDGSNAFDKYYIVSHPKGKIQEWNHWYMIDVTAQIFDASGINPFQGYDYSNQNTSIILENIRHSQISLTVFGSKYVRFRWDITYLDTDKYKNEYLVTKKQDVLDAGYTLEKFGDFSRAFKSSKLTWSSLYKQSLMLYSPKEKDLSNICTPENYKNHSILQDGATTEYQTFTKEWVTYGALSTFDSIVQKMKPNDFYSHQDATYIILYDIPPVWSNPKIAIQQLVDSQDKVVPYPNSEWYNIKSITCKVERYNTSKDICARSLTKKNWYQFFHIARDMNQVKLQKEKGITVSCGNTLLWPSEPNQYFIYSEKTGKILYVNTTQDPYPFDPTSIDF